MEERYEIGILDCILSLYSTGIKLTQGWHLVALPYFYGAKESLTTLLSAPEAS